MKYLTTQLFIKKMSLSDFHQLIQDKHHLGFIDIVPYMTSFHNGKIYSYNQTVAYQINQNNNCYEYIFNELENSLYISLDINNNDYIDLTSYLIDNNLLEEKIFLYNQVKQGNKNNLDDIISFIENESLLPVIYLNQSLSTYDQTLLNSLKTIAYVLSSDDQLFHQEFQKHFQLRNNSYILYLNHEFQKISLLKNENIEDFIKRVQIKVQNYITQRTYPFPYNMKAFQHFVIQKLIEDAKENEDQKVSHIEIQLSTLESKKETLLNDIDTYSKKIQILENQNNELNDFLKQQDNIPLILKGDEKEFYEGEQKDLILFLLEEEIKNTNNLQLKEMVEDILQQNPAIGTRKRYLSELFNMLIAENKISSSKKSLEALKRYGICINHAGKHLTGTFFNDSRYTITFSSTPGDKNIGRQYYRQIRNLFY